MAPKNFFNVLKNFFSMYPLFSYIIKIRYTVANKEGSIFFNQTCEIIHKLYEILLTSSPFLLLKLVIVKHENTFNAIR